MTIIINFYFLCYWAVSIIIEAADMYWGFKTVKKELEKKPMAMMIWNSLKTSMPANLEKIRKIIFGPTGYILGFVFLAIASPFMLPFTLIRHFKKAIGYKSKLDKQADAETKQMEEAEISAKEFMKHEGVRAWEPIEEKSTLVICPVTNKPCEDVACNIGSKCNLAIVAETSVLTIKEDNICPVTKLPCDDECCTPGSQCNLSPGTEVAPPEQPHEAVSDVDLKLAPDETVATADALEIADARYVLGYKIKVFFSNGKWRTVDFEPFLFKKNKVVKFRKLSVFKKFKVENGLLMWGKNELILNASELYSGKVRRRKPPMDNKK